MSPGPTEPRPPPPVIPWRHRLLTRTIALLIVPAILPLVLVFGAVFYYVGADAKRETEAQLLSSVAEARQRAEYYFTSLEGDMRFVASRFNHDELEAPENALLIIAFATTTHRDIETVWLQPAGGAGSVIYSRREMLDRTARPPIPQRAAEAAKDVAWHSTRHDEFGEPILTGSVPIRHPWEVRASGWLIFTIRPQHHLRLAKSIDVGRTGAAFLVDPEGHLVGGSAGHAAVGESEAAPHPAVRWLREARGGGDAARLAHERGRVIAWSPISPAGWGVVVQRDHSEVYATRNRLAWMVVAAFMGLVALTVPLVVSFSLRVTRPVSSLLEAMRRFGAGELPDLGGLPVEGELAALGRAFREMTEQRLQSEERYREIVDSTDNLVAQVDGSGRFSFVNRISEKVFGLGPDAVIGRLAFSFVHPEDRERTERWLADCIERQASQATVENRQVSTDGRTITHWLWNCHLSYDAQGRFAGMSGIAHDITERKVAEEEKRKLDERLLQSRRLESIGRLAGGVAHDFNNILGAIVGDASLLQLELRPDDPLRLHAEQILSSAERAVGVTQGLLAFSRKQIIHPRTLELNATVRKVDSFLSRVIGEDVSLTLSLCDEPLFVHADVTQVEQVLMNLAANARDAMPKGGLLVIATERVEDAVLPSAPERKQPCALLSVTDSGIGMDAETQARVFEPFFTTKEVGRGTGLGLAIVYGIIQQSQGHIAVQSDPGRGTTFRIWFPIVAAAPAEQPVAAAARPLERGTETILLAEDDQAIRRVMRRVLSEHGYVVIEAEDGEAALRTFEAHADAIQLIVTDVVMPKMSGREFFREARARKPGIEVIFTSGYPSEIVQELGALDGGIHFIPKPATPQDLLRKIREVLDLRVASRSEAPAEV